ncbi:hypothetical protein Lal_00020731 [Lupinus albus]|nr:hypothetical protein Lal_00020731 [Lupinus albus]
MLLHDSRNDDGIKSFFQEVHELYIKTLLNPLYLPGSRITSSHFDTKDKVLYQNLSATIHNPIKFNSDTVHSTSGNESSIVDIVN